MPGSRDYSYPLRVAADKYPERTVFICRDERWSFRDFDRATDRLAAAFEARGLTGQRVVAAAAERAADGDDDARPGAGRRGRASP